VLRRGALKKKIHDEAHTSRHSIHPGSTKMYHDLMQQFWWTRMKHKVACYVPECDTCWKVKTDYMKSRRLLQPLSILDWKWEDISMDFNVGLPSTAPKFDSIWVIMDRFTNRSLYTCQHHLHGSEVCGNLHCPSAMLARGSEDNHLQSRVVVCRLHLGVTTRAPWDSFDSQFGLSSIERWQN
jgi:hypothetical protein